MPYCVLILGCVLLLLSACAELDQSLKILGMPATNGPLDETKIAAGLKEVLQVGSGNAVSATGRPDGYFRNQAINILMPEQLQAFEKGLRTVGFGPQGDEFAMSMNRAAELAGPQAKQISLGAIREMTFADAGQILQGPQTAATDYFKARTTDRLTSRQWNKL
jgi:hypothetical protein